VSNKVEFSASVLKPPVITKFNQSNHTMATKSSVINKFETRRPQKEFAPDRQRPIMSHECLITTPNYVPKFEHNGKYVSRPATRHKPSMASSTDVKHVLSVRVTDKKCMCGYSQHCNCSTEPFISYVNKDASGKVAFPRSNSNRIFNAQYPTGMRKLNFPSGKTADSFVKAQNSSDRIVRQNRIEMNQSASRVSSQSATSPIGQSESRVHAITNQSEVAWVSSDPYKSRRIEQFNITAISETEDDTSATIQTTIRHRTTKPVLFRATLRHLPVRHRRCRGRSTRPGRSVRTATQGRPALTCVESAATNRVSRRITVVICWHTTP